MNHPGTKLPNGATIVLWKGDTVLAVKYNGMYSEYIVWSVDVQGATFHGDYFPIPRHGHEDAFEKAVERFKARAQ